MDLKSNDIIVQCIKHGIKTNVVQYFNLKNCLKIDDEPQII